MRWGCGRRSGRRTPSGIRWATVGILKQAWPTDQQAIRNAAVRVAQATLEEMRAAGDERCRRRVSTANWTTRWFAIAS